MWMKHNKNNNATMSMFTGKVESTNYTPPERPKTCHAYEPKDLADHAIEYRSGFQLERQDFVHLYFRARRANYDQILWQLISMGNIQKDHAYDAENLPYWTISIRVRVRTHVPFGRVMNALKELIGIKHPGLRFCLDGFYGMRGFSDVFNSPDACPWMEVSTFATAASLRLMDGDNVFLNTATPAQITSVVSWRRQKLFGNASDLHPKPAKPVVVVEDVKSDMSNVIGNIVYDQADDFPVFN